MRRIISVLAVMAIVAAMAVAMAMPAFAAANRSEFHDCLTRLKEQGYSSKEASYVCRLNT